MGDPSKLSRDAKGLVADFRGELKLRDPWDREIDIQFKRIQRKYKDILFDHPFARQAHSVDQALWTDTSYALITQYRARIDPVRTSPPNKDNIVENRKILQKFLAFLGAEGTFWSGIVSRLVRIHGLTEVNGAMAALGMNVVEFENRESLARHGQAEIAPALPEEATAPTHPPPSHELRSNKLLVVFRALIYLGDIARYREQYGTHPNKGNSEPSTKRSRGGRRGRGGGTEKPSEKPFSKAEAFYIQARLLLPDYGNPFNQLAIVYSYQHDFFGAALNYYRALCVRKPFPTAQDNLVRTLAKCLEADREMWRERREHEADGSDLGKGKGKAQPAGKSPDNDASKDLESRFKHDVVLLHALWAGKCRSAKLARHTQNVLASFASLVSRRLLPAATIVQVFVITLGALWRVRMFKSEGDHQQERKRKTKGEDEQDIDIPLETLIVAHLIALYTVLLEIGTREIQDGVNEVGGMGGDERQRSEKLAQRITGTFRRTLPALRIANKWIKANVRYLQQYPLEGGKEFDAPASILPNTMRPNLDSFWRAWSRFDVQLSNAFPLELLPSISVDLEEDTDMKGFSPLKWGPGGGASSGREGVENEAASVHPNEEQLMRIGDLIVDNKYITTLPECHLVSGLPMQSTQPQAYININSRIYERWDDPNDGTDLGSDDGVLDNDFPNQEDDRATVSTRTDDDPVHLAMNARLSDDDEDDEGEQILYPQGYRQRPVSISMSPPPQSASPLETGLPAWPPPTPSFLSEPAERSAPHFNQPLASRPTGTTAEDLLNRVLNGTPTFLNMPTNSLGNDTSVITSNTSFGGRSISMHGPTPSFLAPSTQTRSFSAFNLPAPGLNSRQNLSRSPPQPSPLSNARSSSLSITGPPATSLPGRPNNSAASLFPSHTRLPSLTGATSIWTPAPQEVTRTPSWGTNSRTGSMRSNSIAGGMIPPASVPEGTWPTRNQGFGDMEVSRLMRQQTYAGSGDPPRWG